MTSDKKWRDNFDRVLLRGKLWYESDALDESDAKIERLKAGLKLKCTCIENETYKNTVFCDACIAIKEADEL